MLFRYGEHFYFYIIKLPRVQCERTYTHSVCIRDTVFFSISFTVVTTFICDHRLHCRLIIKTCPLLRSTSALPVYIVTAASAIHNSRKMISRRVLNSSRAESDLLRKVVNLNPKTEDLSRTSQFTVPSEREKKQYTCHRPPFVISYTFRRSTVSYFVFVFLLFFFLIHGIKGNREKKFGRIIACSTIAAVIQGIIICIIFVY